MTPPFILGVGGTTRSGSSTELALRSVLREVERLGGRSAIVTGADLVLPPYAPDSPDRDPKAAKLLDLLRRADGVIVASPGYHGSVSGLVKNALDYVEDTAADPRPYFDGRAVGCIACAYGWQATGSTLAALRAIVHALRGWPTPLGVAANTSERLFDGDGACADARLAQNLTVLAGQVVQFATLAKLGRALEASPEPIGQGQADDATGGAAA